MATTQQNDFVKAVYKAAQELYNKNPTDSINPLFITAQAALESGWGQKAIGNNLFGITRGSSWKGKTKLILTTEYFNTPSKIFNLPERIERITTTKDGLFKYKVWRLFRDYDSIEDCLEDHLEILRKPIYKDAWIYRNDAVVFAKHIAAKYATAPDYADTMRILIRQVEIIIEKLGL